MSALLSSTPQADGYRMPAEFEPHAGCWMLFPERPDVWSYSAAPAQEAYTAVAKAISRFEPVTIGALPNVYETARSVFADSRVKVVELQYNDAWMRDNGPTFVVDDKGRVRIVDWEFNAWGGELEGLYADWSADNDIPRQVAQHLGLDRYQAGFVVEGGAIHVDGQGTLLTTASCLLNPNRNPHITETQVEQGLIAYTGAEEVIWLDIDANEETDGHVDGVAAFVRPGVVVIDWCDDPDNVSDYANCRRVYEQLSNITDAKGRTFEVHKLPAASPQPLSAEAAATIQQVDASYARPADMPVGGCYVNFYIANGGVIVPTYDDPNDEQALNILADLFPEREIVGVSAYEIAVGGGMIHCITQQQPAG